jgi:hypothetical protein
MDTKRNIIMVAAGLGFGTAVGILLAPKSGPGTRDYLRSKARLTADRVRDVVENRKSMVEGAIGAGRQAYEEALYSPPRSSLSAIGILAEAALLIGAFNVTRPAGKYVQKLLPKMEGLLDECRSAVVKGARELEAFGTRGRQFLDAAQTQLREASMKEV